MYAVERPCCIPGLQQPGNDQTSHTSFKRLKQCSLAKGSSNEGGCLHMEDELKVLVPTECDGSFLCFVSVYKELSSRLRGG